MAADQSDAPFESDFSLPALSDSDNSAADAFWKKLLGNYELTGPHLYWHRNELARIELTFPYGYPAEDAADEIGLGRSVKVAEAFFDWLFNAYWPRFRSSGARFEIFLGWLHAIERKVVAKIETVWTGGSDDVRRWYWRACEPAIKKALAARVKAKEIDTSPTPEEKLLRDIKEQLGKIAQATAQATAADATTSHASPATEIPDPVSVPKFAEPPPPKPRRGDLTILTDPHTGKLHRYVTVRQAAEFAGLSEHRIAELIKGEPPRFRRKILGPRKHKVYVPDIIAYVLGESREKN